MDAHPAVPLTEFYTSVLCGLWDLRAIKGPFKTAREAAISAAMDDIDGSGTGERSEDNRAWVGSWFSLHPKGTYAQGPFVYAGDADLSRKANVKDKQSFTLDLASDKGFVAEVVAIYGDFGVLRRADI